MFNFEFMQAVANNVLNGIAYKGIAYEGDRPNIMLDLPNGGVDVQKEVVQWVLPDGRCVAWTVAELAQKRPDELTDPKARAAYFAIGEEVEYYPLGVLPDEVLDAYRDAPGTLEERGRLSAHSCFVSMSLSSSVC